MKWWSSTYKKYVSIYMKSIVQILQSKKHFSCFINGKFLVASLRILSLIGIGFRQLVLFYQRKYGTLINLVNFVFFVSTGFIGNKSITFFYVELNYDNWLYQQSKQGTILNLNFLYKHQLKGNKPIASFWNGFRLLVLSEEIGDWLNLVGFVFLKFDAYKKNKCFRFRHNSMFALKGPITEG